MTYGDLLSMVDVLTIAINKQLFLMSPLGGVKKTHEMKIYQSWGLLIYTEIYGFSKNNEGFSESWI